MKGHTENCMSQYPLNTGQGYWGCDCGYNEWVLEHEDDLVTLKAKLYEWECPVCEAWNDEADNGRDEVTCAECNRTFTVGPVLHKGA